MAIKKRGRRHIFNNKKGLNKDIFFNVFEYILAAIVVIALFNFIKDIQEGTIFEKNFLVRDISLTINTLYAAPGEVIYAYGENTSKLILDFSESNKLIIYREEEKESESKVFYLYAENKNIPFQHPEILNRKTGLEFSKSEQNLELKLKNE